MNLLQRESIELCFVDQISLGVKRNSPTLVTSTFVSLLALNCVSFHFTLRLLFNYFLKSLEGIALVSSLMPLKRVVHSWRCPSICGQCSCLCLLSLVPAENEVFCLLHMIPFTKGRSVPHCCRAVAHKPHCYQKAK